MDSSGYLSWILPRDATEVDFRRASISLKTDRSHWWENEIKANSPQPSGWTCWLQHRQWTGLQKKKRKEECLVGALFITGKTAFRYKSLECKLVRFTSEPSILVTSMSLEPAALGSNSQHPPRRSLMPPLEVPISSPVQGGNRNLSRTGWCECEEDNAWA